VESKIPFMPNPSLKNVIFTCLFKMLNHLRFISKNLSSIKNTVRRNSFLKDVSFTRKKNCVLVIPFRTNAGDIFDVYLSNLTNTYTVKDNIWSPILTDFTGCTKCCLAIFHQLFQKVTAEIPSKFRLYF
jgi:hypothetical protein